VRDSCSCAERINEILYAIRNRPVFGQVPYVLPSSRSPPHYRPPPGGRRIEPDQSHS
jgi:hypothetical protein